MITKAQIATLLGISAASIDDNIYSWAVQQFYILTGLKGAETDKIFTKNIYYPMTVISLKDTGITAIDSITIDGIAQDLVEDSDYYINTSTGNIKFNTAISGFVQIEYTVGAYVDSAIYSYLVTLLTYKGLYIFNPAITNEVKSITIGKYSKTFNKSTNFMEDIEMEIYRTRDLCLGDDGAAQFEVIF